MNKSNKRERLRRVRMASIKLKRQNDDCYCLICVDRRIENNELLRRAWAWKGRGK